MQRIINTIHRLRRVIVVTLHLGLIALSNIGAFLLRFDGTVPQPQFDAMVQMLPLVVTIRSLIFVPFGLYSGLWRYTSVWDLRRIVAAVMASSIAIYLVVHFGFGRVEYSRSIFVVDSILLIFSMGGVRMMRRVYCEIGSSEAKRKVLVYGAGDAGELIVRDMLKRASEGYDPIGFVDDDRAKRGRRIHGVEVLGTGADLPQIVAEREPREILLALPTADAATIRRIVRTVETLKIKITTLPSLGQIMDGRVSIAQIRSLAPEDLLGRDPIGLDRTPVMKFVSGRRVMVTGAGGSIGSELCRQIASFEPDTLVLLDRYENSLFAIENDLRDRGSRIPITPVVADVTDATRIDDVLALHRPELIFHAAAHKHVPLMEQNPCEAIKNNVGGTRILAEAAERHRVDRFILISTDKAVNPTSVMGASKRIAELLVRSRSVGSSTCYLAVRFGNVLASNGSVVPRFLDQIRNGGPVTVTHPDMRRYFMLIPEAVQLVLQAASGGESGHIYVLEMGEQVKLVDMARNLIRLSGFVPEEEIRITYVGLRPGEKLQEELVGAGETVRMSRVPKVLEVSPRYMVDYATLREQVALLERVASTGDGQAVLQHIKTVVPEFRLEQEGALVTADTSFSGEAVPSPGVAGLLGLSPASSIPLELLDVAGPRPQKGPFSIAQRGSTK